MSPPPHAMTSHDDIYSLYSNDDDTRTPVNASGNATPRLPYGTRTPITASGTATPHFPFADSGSATPRNAYAYPPDTGYPKSRNPFGDSSAPSPRPASPDTIFSSATYQPKPRFKSRRYKKEEIQQPWLQQKDKRAKWARIFPLLGIFLGLAVTAVQCYFGVTGVPKHEYCPVLMEDFSSGTLDPNIWTHEVALGGFGNGEFEQTTTSPDNVYIQDSQLFIKPTLQDESLITTNNVINLLADGTCTSTSWSDCVATTNITNGTIVNPVKSARLNTIKGASIKYGRIEVVAQMPKGDWIWPAIWMLPVNNTYGSWPLSGEIDLVESRGNNNTYPLGGNNVATSTLHWGPDKLDDRYLQTTESNYAWHTTFASGFHTFGLEWSERYLFTYIDSRLNQVLYTAFSEPFWRRGHFPSASANGTYFDDPWTQTGRVATPFDQDFYLILNVAVGGGYFPDNVGGKPWVQDGAGEGGEGGNAAAEFWGARDQWYPSWQESPEMVVQSVKMWQQKGYNGC